jgi:hypothetical protein
MLLTHNLIRFIKIDLWGLVGGVKGFSANLKRVMDIGEIPDLS